MIGGKIIFYKSLVFHEYFFRLLGKNLLHSPLKTQLFCSPWKVLSQPITSVWRVSNVSAMCLSNKVESRVQDGVTAVTSVHTNWASCIWSGNYNLQQVTICQIPSFEISGVNTHFIGCRRLNFKMHIHAQLRIRSVVALNKCQPYGGCSFTCQPSSLAPSKTDRTLAGK